MEKLREIGRNRKDNEAFHEYVMSGAEGGLERRKGGMDKSGWGVFTTQPFFKGDYICQYKGQVMSTKAAKYFNKVNDKRECYQVWVEKRLNGTKYRKYVIDASPDCYASTMGRNINHNAISPTVVPRYFFDEEHDYECVYFEAKDYIEVGTELSWDYADHRTGTTLGSWEDHIVKESLRKHRFSDQDEDNYEVVIHRRG